MNPRWNLGWRDSARLKYGLHWRKHTPTLSDYEGAARLTIRAVMAILAVLLIWAWAMDRDYAEQAQRGAVESETQLVACLNGEAKWVSEDGTYMVACEKAWSTRI